VGMTKTFQDVFFEMRTAWLEYIRKNFSRLRDPSELLGDQARVMLGRGEISQEQYAQISWRLSQGSLGRGDLELLRRQARKQHQEQAGPEHPFQDRAIAAGLDRLYIRIARLGDARRGAEKALRDLEVDLERVREFARSAEDLARKTLPDENEARLILEIRQNMLDRLQALEERKRSLERDLRRLEAMQGELYAYEAELKILEAQSGLEGMGYSGWAGLPNQEAIETHGGNK
jgi:hypothetical protein